MDYTTHQSEPAVLTASHCNSTVFYSLGRQKRKTFAKAKRKLLIAQTLFR